MKILILSYPPEQDCILAVVQYASVGSCFCTWLPLLNQFHPCLSGNLFVCIISFSSLCLPVSGIDTAHFEKWDRILYSSWTLSWLALLWTLFRLHTIFFFSVHKVFLVSRPSCNFFNSEVCFLFDLFFYPFLRISHLTHCCIVLFLNEWFILLNLAFFFSGRSISSQIAENFTHVK